MVKQKMFEIYETYEIFINGSNKIKNVTDEMIFPISGTIRIFNNTPFYMKKIGSPISEESRKLNLSKQAQP